MYTSKNFVPITDSGSEAPSNVYVSKNFVPINQGTNGTSPSSIGSGILNAINEAGGTVGRGLAYAGADIANVPIAAANYLNQKLAGAFGVQPQNVPTPGLINPQAIPMPFVSQQAQQELDPLAKIGAATALLAQPATDVAKLGAALTSAGGKALLTKLQNTSFAKTLMGQNIQDATQQFGNEARNTLTGLFGESKITPQDELQQNTHEVLQQMYGAPDYKNLIGNENQILSQNVFNAHQQNYALGSARFDKTLEDTNPIISPEEAHINPAESSQLEKAMKMDPLLADKIITANDTPNLRNLHEVQSQMGAMIADKKSVPYSQRDNESINILSSLRDKIINNISTYAPQYKDDQAFWKNNVIPYYQNSAINKLVRQGVQPANISNILSKPELATQPNHVPGTVNTILSHLTPQQQQYIPLAKLAGSQSNPLMDLSGNINENNFAKSAQGLTTKNISQFITPQIKQQLQGLGQDLKDANLYNNITNNVQDISGNINPDQLVKNMQGIDSTLLNPMQRASIQQSLSKLSDMSENIKKEQLKTERLGKLLKRSAWATSILGGIETGRKIL